MKTRKVAIDFASFRAKAERLQFAAGSSAAVSAVRNARLWTQFRSVAESAGRKVNRDRAIFQPQKKTGLTEKNRPCDAGGNRIFRSVFIEISAGR